MSNKISAEVVQWWLEFYRDTTKILSLYDFSAVANLFPVAQAHIASILQSWAGKEMIEKRFKENNFEKEEWLKKPKDTLWYKVARILKDQQLEERYKWSDINSDVDYSDARMLLCHDIYHLILDFPLNPTGEVGLHAALFAQNQYPRAIPVIAGVLLSQKTPEWVEKIVQICVNWYKKGLSMKNLFEIDWSEYLDMSLEEARGALTIH